MFDTSYNSEWYEASSKSTKLLNMIMLRSTTPCTLTIGKIVILSIPTFSAVRIVIMFFYVIIVLLTRKYFFFQVMRVSASYFTVMQSIH